MAPATLKERGMRTACRVAGLKNPLAWALLAWSTLALSILSLGIGPAHSQTDFPDRRIHVIVPYPAGGIVDVLTRILSDRLSNIWHQPILVETRPGANGNLAWDQASRAAPDGYTWTFAGPGLLANPGMYPNLRFSEKSFVPVGAVAWAPSVFLV